MLQKRTSKHGKTDHLWPGASAQDDVTMQIKCERKNERERKASHIEIELLISERY